MDLLHMSTSKIEQHLLNLWNKADMLSGNSPEYSAIVDEVLAIRGYTRKNSIELSPEIAARFQHLKILKRNLTILKGK